MNFSCKIEILSELLVTLMFNVRHGARVIPVREYGMRDPTGDYRWQPGQLLRLR